MNETDDWSERLAHWDEARQRLRLRVYPDAWVAQRDSKVIARVDYSGLQAVAVLDLPNVVAVAAFEHLDCWDQTSEEVLAIALVNSLEEATESEVQLRGQVGVVLVHGTHMYTSAHALAPERHLPNLGQAGAIVSLPCRDLVLLHRLGQASVAHALMTIGDMTRVAKEADSAPLSADLFWFRGPAYKPVRIGTSEGVGFVKAIADEQVVRAMRAASGRSD
jgi:hypothetical protein